MILNRVGLASMVVGAWASIAGAEPFSTAFTYQGKLQQNGTPLNEDAEIRFELVDDTDTVIPGTLPITVDYEPNSDGLFTTELDWGVEPFNGEERYLRIAVRLVPAGAFNPLSPNQRISPVPIASQVRGLHVDADLNIGVGTTSPTAKLEVDGGDVQIDNGGNLTMFSGLEPDVSTVHFDAQYFGGSLMRLRDSDAVNTVEVRSDPAQFMLRNAGGVRVSIQANPSNEGGSISLRNDDNVSTVLIQAEEQTNFGAAITLANQNATDRIKLFGDKGDGEALAGVYGDVGAGTTVPEARLHVRSEASDSRPSMIVETLVPNGQFIYPAILEVEGNAIDSYFNGAASPIRLNPNNAGPVLMGIGGGDVGIGEAGPEGQFHIQEENLGVDFTMLSSPDLTEMVVEAKDAAIELFSNGGGNWGSAITFGEVVGGALVNKWAIARRTGEGELRITHGSDPGHANNPWMLRIHPDGTTKVKVLEITGADLAEKFPTSEPAQPGMVMAIDPHHPGKLCLARGAYNRTVAGVVSGANGFAVGAVLGNLPGVGDDAPPIALSGRVYVWCDAAAGAIQPGDLLTTSQVPGHAMRVSDHSRAQGAIMGKAMTTLDSGKGLVLVLVSLQ